MVATTERPTLDVIRETNPAYIMDRQGKDFVLYAGLLDAATRRGLSGIQTRIIQAPSADNGQTTIVHARAIGEDGRAFDGIGDANPVNTSRAIAPHAIRMAETRAKARALRDFLNLGGVAAFEELGGPGDDGDRQAHNDPPPAPPKPPGPPPAPPRAAPGDLRRDHEHAPIGPGAVAPPATPPATRPALNVVLPPEHQELIATVKRGLIELGRPVDDEAIAKMSLTMLQVQVRALADAYFELHPDKDHRPKRAAEAPVTVDARTQAAIAKSAQGYQRSAARTREGPAQVKEDIVGYTEDDVTF